MDVTHLGHACLLVETDRVRLLIDPGTLSTGFADLRDLDAVLVTHEHPDHVDDAAVRALVASNPGATLVLDELTGARFADLDAVRVAHPGETLDLGERVDEEADPVGLDEQAGVAEVGDVHQVGSFTKRWVISPIPSKRLTSVSPGRRKRDGESRLPTPSGVPVKIRSPGRSSQTDDRWATRRGIEKIRSAVRPDWSGSPSRVEAKAMSSGSSSSSGVTIQGPVGPNPPCDLPSENCAGLPLS